MEHFGLWVCEGKYSLKLKREEFALINTKSSFRSFLSLPYPFPPAFSKIFEQDAYIDDTYSEYKKEWCEKYRKLCIENYDLNMKYFDALDVVAFNEAIAHFLKKHKKLHEIDDLTQYRGVSGYYILVLDEYKQVYIGKSKNITRRIQEHWRKVKPFDRTLLPVYAVQKSCFSIDFFRALDTTRIFVWERKVPDGRDPAPDKIEEKLIRDFPKEYLTNRIGGDITTLIEALATMNRRDL